MNIFEVFGFFLGLTLGFMIAMSLVKWLELPGWVVIPAGLLFGGMILGTLTWLTGKQK